MKNETVTHAANGSAAREVFASRPWLARYPAHCPPELAREPNTTARSLLDEACARWAGRTAFESGERRTDYRDWRRDARAIASWWANRCDVPPGARVLLLLPNLVEFPVAMYAAWIAGLVVVPVNPASTAHELQHPIADAEPAVVVTTAALAVRVREALSARALFGRRPQLLVVDGESRAGGDSFAFADALHDGASRPPPARPLGPGDVALLQYTGGTTGVSKAVVSTHANLVAQVRMLCAMFSDRIVPGADLVLAVHPFFHSLGVAMNLLQYATNGATNVLHAKPKDFAGLVALLAQRPVNAIVGGPALYHGLLAEPGFAGLDFSALRTSFVGGMPLRPDILERWERTTATPMVEGYGLTEVAGAAIVQFDGERRPGSVGLPGPSLEVTLRDESGAPLAAGQPGELWVRGPCLMPGYYRHEEETARAMTDDGWFRTGDVARIDADGYVYLLDRIKDIIIVSNSNVYPTEIESVVGAHPGVADVCAVGMPDAATGEAVRIVVVRRDPALDEDTIAQWCAQHLADYKCPKRIEFRDALPRSAVGKVLRRALRDSL